MLAAPDNADSKARVWSTGRPARTKNPNLFGKAAMNRYIMSRSINLGEPLNLTQPSKSPQCVERVSG